MERLNGNLGSLQGPLQERPIVLHRVGMDVPVHVFDRVVDDFVLELFGQASVGGQFITEDCRPRFDMLFDALLKLSLAAVFNGHGANRATALHHSESNDLTGIAAALFLRAALALFVHMAGLATDEGFVNLNLTPEFSAQAL